MLLTLQCVSQCVVFGDFRFNMPTRELLRIGNHGLATPVTLGSRAADLLHLFLDRPGELITKSEIMDAVWPHMAVEESNLTVQISALRRALGGCRNGARYIQTVPGRGYRFTPWVDDFAGTMEDSTPEFAITNQSGPVLPACGLDAPQTVAAGPSRESLGVLPDSLSALREMTPLSLPLPLPAVLPEARADGVPMAVSHVERTNVWWLPWLNGVAGIILGLMLITAPGITTAALVSFLGFYWLIMGMLALVRVFVDQSVPWIWPLVSGVLGILAGVFMVRHLLVAASIMPTAIIVALGALSLILGGLEILIGLIGAGIASFILGAIYLLAGLLLLGSLHAAALAGPLTFGALFVVQGAALTAFAVRARSWGRLTQMVRSSLNPSRVQRSLTSS
jgi:DNA-binding winged helix-turn-helix (wHTH) protein/uncharacterized membrane protein HdeD (DUF308 family)